MFSATASPSRLIFTFTFVSFVTLFTSPILPPVIPNNYQSRTKIIKNAHKSTSQQIYPELKLPPESRCYQTHEGPRSPLQELKGAWRRVVPCASEVVREGKRAARGQLTSYKDAIEAKKSGRGNAGVWKAPYGGEP